MNFANKYSAINWNKYIIVVMHFVVAVSFGQNIKFGHYSEKNGLSYNSVRHIIQDKNGFLWLGTFFGLNRFDGYQFNAFMSTDLGANKINNDDITALEYDQQANNLWIGTRKGLTLLNLVTNKYTLFLPEKNNPNSIIEEEIRSVHVDKFKRVWIGTMTKGICIYYPNQKKFVKVSIKGFEYIKEIIEDKKGNIWIGSFGTAAIAKITIGAKGELQKISSYTLSIPNSSQINPYINFIFENKNQALFVGTREGLYKLNLATNTFENLYIKDPVLRNKLGPYFISVAQAPDGKFWLGTLGGIIVCNQLEDVANGDFQRYFSKLTDENSLIGNVVNTLYFDKAGVLWIGTEDGLDQYDPYSNQFKLNTDISLYNDNQKPSIRGFSKTYNGNVIVATRFNGLFISKEKAFVPLHNNKNNIASIYSSDGKIFYCGLWDGRILVYNYLTNTSKVISIGLKNSPIISFLTLNDSALVVGTFGEGAVILDKNTLKVTMPAGVLLPGVQINKIRLDKAQNLWFATETGVAKYNRMTKRLKIYAKDKLIQDGLPDNHISDLVIADNQQIWVATVKGLALYNAQKDLFTAFKNVKELSGKWITDLEFDSSGNLWMNMNNNSVVRYNIVSKKINTYSIDSGNRLDVFSSKGFYKLDQSKIYLGGKNGVVYFSIANIKENRYAPMPVITDFKLQNESVNPGQEINGQIPLLKDINSDKSVTLNYNNRNFSIQFSSPSFSNQRLNKFQYMLEGFDKQWITTNSISRSIQYTNLNPKKYVFKIRSSNSDGIWSKVNSYQIHILPPFWTGTKIFLLIVLLGSIAGYFIKNQIKSRIKLKQALLLERVKRNSDERLANDKLEFFTNISHELRTPLTLILGPAKQLLEQDGSKPYDLNKINLIYQNANRLLGLVNQILDFRKAQSGKLKLKVSKNNIYDTTQIVCNSFVQLAQEKNISFNFSCEDHKLQGWIDLDKYHKILYNLLSNAIKFTNNYGSVDVFLSVKEEGAEKRLVLEVSDDGIGIPLESQEKIFSRFYQVKSSKKNNTGSGIGLSLVLALVELHRGLVKLSSTPGKGSIFTIELPITKSSFKKNEVFDLEIDSAKNNDFVFEKPKKIKQNTTLIQSVVVIEDNMELRSFIVDYLSDFYKVFEAANGEEGIQLCRQVKPVLCVVDAMMPLMNGFEFLEMLKKDDEISHTAVIMLTALSENENKIRGFSLGADDYMVKPFDPSVLKIRIDNIIKTRAELKQRFSGEVEADVSTLTHSQLDIDFILKVTILIEENIANPDLTASFLCDTLGMSTSKLYRKIKLLTDLAPNEFIRTVRLKKAATLLKSKNHNVSEIADMVGFNDPLYFSRCFKKQFGYSPSKLIK